MINLHLEYIGEATIDRRVIAVYRYPDGKWCVKCDEIVTEKRLNCAELVKFLLDAINNKRIFA